MIFFSHTVTNFAVAPGGGGGEESRGREKGLEEKKERLCVSRIVSRIENRSEEDSE